MGMVKNKLKVKAGRPKKGTRSYKVSGKVTAQKGPNPARPPHWGGFRITPVEIEFWADGAFRLHDRFRWTRSDAASPWSVERLNP